jgi:hypothetical protein
VVSHIKFVVVAAPPTAHAPVVHGQRRSGSDQLVEIGWSPAMTMPTHR